MVNFHEIALWIILESLFVAWTVVGSLSLILLVTIMTETQVYSANNQRDKNNSNNQSTSQLSEGGFISWPLNFLCHVSA